MLMIGECGVGKSCLLRRFAQGSFTEEYQKTIGVEFGTKEIIAGGHKNKLQIWDTSGDERFDGVTRSYYLGSIGIFILYDITDAQTFAKVPKWIDRVRQHSCREGLHVMLVGTKADQEQNRQISTQEGQGLADLHHLHFMETSAKDMLNVEEVFMQMTGALLKNVG
uniref:Uncharacterized protein n=1 Tax=Arcella intermedia TaxID=1963864 RepID=A0A6B2LMC4_9EUKA